MSKLLEKIKDQTRWDTIPSMRNAYRLLCNHEVCSLSCANAKNGRLSITSVHGADRHSYTLTKKDMTFLTLMFLDSLNTQDLDILTKLFNKLSEEHVLTSEKI